MKNSRQFLLLALLALPILSWAGPPMKSTACGESINIRAPRGGAGVFLDETCETAYVLPPAFGLVQLQGVAPTASVDDCRELTALEMTRANLAERLARASQRPLPDNGTGSTIGGGGGLGGGGTAAPIPEQDAEKIRAESEWIRKELINLHEAEKIFTQTEGLVAKLIYSLDHEGMVAEYARLNAGSKIKNFVRLPLEVAYLSMADKDEKVRDTRSEVLSYTVPGLAKLPDEEGPGAPSGSVYFGSALSGKVQLTVKAACKLMSQFSGRVPETLSASQLEKHLSSNITYGYGLNVRRQYYAKYNFKKLFEHIATQTQSGGFLSSKSVNEVVERNDSSSWFTFRATSDDTRYPNELLAQQLKAEMINRVMGQIAIGTVPGSTSLPSTLDPGPKGVDVAAAGLKKCPYVYCQIAGYVLDFVSATFGSSQAVARFLSTVGSESTEQVDESKTLRFHGTSTFKDRI